jgi:hypothetical protein
MFNKIMFKIQGLSPTMMHNGQLANPLNPYAKALKAVSSKRKKTDEDFEKMAMIEWEGSLYFNHKGQIVWPGHVLEGALCGAAAKQKLKKVAQSGMFVEEDAVLEYDGPKDIEALKKDPKFRFTTGVRVQNARIMRTRPFFQNWGLSFVITYDPSLFDEQQVIQIVEILGAKVGLSDFRPRYGRFTVVSAKPLK